MDMTATAAKPKAGDYDTFLRMMTVQIRNQDPMSPMKSDEFAVQLATFSTVEQQTRTNDLLTQQIQQNTQNTMAQMSGWVGKEARIAAPALFDGSTPITLSPNPALTADRAVLVVKDQGGNEVSRTDLPVTSADYQWQGLSSDGTPLPEGIYSLELESFEGDRMLGRTPVEFYAPITEIRSGPGGITALFPGGVEVSTAIITGLRQPSS